MDLKQKYNQDTDGLSQFEFQLELEIGCQRSEYQLQAEGLGPQGTTVEHPSQNERSAAMVRRPLGQYVAVSPRLQLTSHTQETSPF